jgi:phage portal protein BeeE
MIFKFPFFKRLINGNYLYTQRNSSSCDWKNYAGYGSYIELVDNHTILLPCFKYIQKYFSNVVFDTINDKGESKPHWVLDTLNNPNPYQSKEDFLDQWIKYFLANGYTYLYNRTPSGVKDDGTFYNLNIGKVDFPEDYKSTLLFNGDEIKVTIVYDKENLNAKINFKDIIPYYDNPNGECTENFLIGKSRIDSLIRPIQTVSDAYDAKNIAIKTNGKELITSKGDLSSSLLPKEKKEIEDRLNNNYGLGIGRSRSIVSSSQLEHKSLHIALKSLGLDDSIIRDAQIIIAGFGIPQDGLKYDSKNSTFENQKEAEIKYVQSTIQNLMNQFTSSLTNKYTIQDGLTLIGKYDHLPILQENKIEKYEAITEQQTALSALLANGVSTEEALKIVDMQGVTIEESNQENTEDNGEEE